jgi:hypothetical protein
LIYPYPDLDIPLLLTRMKKAGLETIEQQIDSLTGLNIWFSNMALMQPVK